jgi:hypothetical protein
MDEKQQQDITLNVYFNTQTHLSSLIYTSEAFVAIAIVKFRDHHGDTSK